MGESSRYLIPKVESICRACCGEVGFMSPIFDAIPGTLPAMISFCTGLEMKRDDSKPNQICEMCLENLNIAYNFKTTYLRSNQQFIKMLYGIEYDVQIRLDDKDQIKIEDYIDNGVDEPEIEIPSVEVEDQFSEEHSLFVERINVKVESGDEDELINDEDGGGDEINGDEINGDEMNGDENSDDDDDEVPLSKIKEQQPKKRKEKNTKDGNTQENKNLLEVAKQRRNPDKVTTKRVHKSHKRYCCGSCGALFCERILFRAHLLEVHDIHMPLHCKNNTQIVSGSDICQMENLNALKTNEQNIQSDNCQIEEPKTKSNVQKNKKSVKKGRKKSCQQNSDECQENSDKCQEKSDNCQQESEEGMSTNKVIKPQIKRILPSSGRSTKKCDVCELKFATVTNMKRHRKAEHGDRTCVCEFCGKECRLHNFRAHYQRHFRGTIACGAAGCSYETYSRPELIRHETYAHDMHKKPDPYQCSKCGQQFRQRGHMRDHVQRVHEGRKKNKVCPAPGCGAAFHRNSHLTKHLQSHSDDKPYSCDQCGSKFGYRTNLRAHALKVHGTRLPKLIGGCKRNVVVPEKTLSEAFVRPSDVERIKCPFCPYEFTRRQNLKQHVQKVHARDPPPRAPKERKKPGPRPPNYHTCSICAARLTRRSYYRYHMAALHGLSVPKFSNQAKLDQDATAKAAAQAQEPMEE